MAQLVDYVISTRKIAGGGFTAEPGETTFLQVRPSARCRSEWRVAQCAFIGADVSAASLSVKSDWASPMYERVTRLTNYQNPFDSVLGVSNAKRLGTSPRAGRVGLPAGPLERHPKSTNVNCGAHFQTLDPKKSVFFGTFNHSWHIGDRVFARDLAMTLEGSIDRYALPTRRRVEGELILINGARPLFQKDWNLERGAPVDARRRPALGR